MSIEPAALGRITCLLALLAAGMAAAGESGAPEPAPDAPVAMIGKTPVTYDELKTAAFNTLSNQEAEYESHRSQLLLQYERDRHSTLDKEVETLVNKRVLDLEAQKEHTTPDQLLAKLEKPTVTDADLRKLYDEHKDETKESFEQLQGRMRDFVAQQKTKAISDNYYASLRAKYHAEITLEPLRAKVSTEGPSRGSTTAPVTIVEFADFQCPYCRQMEPVLAQALKQYPGSVRIVFRNYPLTEIHPQAMQAAEAAMCANQQGKFWEMHDSLYTPAADLSVAGLRAAAKNVGLDSQKFEECVRGQETVGAIQNDREEGIGLALIGTPALFINGRLIPGTASLHTLNTMIDDELRRKKSSPLASASVTSAR